jgi:hypothetical protein
VFEPIDPSAPVPAGVGSGATEIFLSVEKLIGVEVVHFKADTPDNILTGKGAGAPAPGQRAALLDGDALLATGLVNPGFGSGLTENPGDETFGMGVKFTQPVVNHPGPDVVIVEVDEEGTNDAFVVSPLVFDREGLRGAIVTEKAFNQSGDLNAVDAYQFANVPSSLDDVESGPLAPDQDNPQPLRYYTIGLDLSALGYADGEKVEGLFIQSLSDEQRVDPVFIAALPTRLPGDGNNDGLVTGLDLIAVQQNFALAENGVLPTGLLPGDTNDDGKVSGLDLIATQQNFGQAVASSPPVPEPATWGFFVAAGIVGLRNRRLRAD